MKTGLVLEGGAMRGLYTAGVLDILSENDIKVDGVIGVSAGVVHGVNYASGQTGRSIRYTLKYRGDKRYMSVRSLLKSGNMVETKFCYHDIPEKLDPFDNKSFKNSGIDFYAVCSNVETGEAEFIKCTDLKKQIDVVRASASMPFVSQIVETEGMKLLDGGICDSVPVKKFLEMGYDRLIVVLTKVKGYIPKKNNAVMAKKVYGEYPDFVDALITRHLRYGENLRYVNEMEKEGKILVIRPSRTVEISRTEKNLARIWEMYDLGRDDAAERLSEVKAWLQEK
ncbi:hypothetical protein IMSAG049_01753 [Clostridiales bacterium]|nr:hypothetical protein IMSAG049_01753 [Clostridiales bacterium]